MRDSYFSLLCLGDSYTVGEAVKLYESFPYRLVQNLRNNTLHFYAPEIVAATGFTSDELLELIENYSLNESYDFVTLLVGVNNQYRGLALEKFESEFEQLLNKSISFVNSKADHVVLISIPDWGVTPFAKNWDQEKISLQINEFNAVIQKLAYQYKTSYLNITDGSRQALTDETLVASDGLHPSGKEYEKWASGISAIIEGLIKK